MSNPTDARRTESPTLAEILRRRAKEQPDEMVFAYLADGEATSASLTYAELDRRARAIGAELQRRGMAGKPAVMLYPQGLLFIEAFFGCLYAGTIAVPAYPPRNQRHLPRLQAIVRDAGAGIALADADTAIEVQKFLERAGAAEDGLQVLSSDGVGDELAAEWREGALDHDLPAYLQYTSGSTTTPRGVIIGHANLLHQLENDERLMELSPQTVSVSWLPCFHDMGLMVGVLQSVYTGYPTWLMSPIHVLQQPLRWLQAISTHRATYSGGPNFAFELCLAKADPVAIRTLDLSSWRNAFNASEPVRPETMERFALVFGDYGLEREALCASYGLAEATLVVAAETRKHPPRFWSFDGAALGQGRVVPAERNAEGARRLPGYGEFIHGQRVVIADPRTKLPCPPDRIGEIWVAGPSVASGYWRHPERSADILQARLADTDEGPFLRTGDLGFMQDGILFVTGRLKDVILIRGVNHYPQDVELTVEGSHPSLRPGCGAAFSIDLEGEERLVIAYEVRREAVQGLDGEAVARAVRGRIAQDHGLRTHAVVLLRPGHLPKTSSGKVQRSLCRKLFLDGELAAILVWKEERAPAAGPGVDTEPPSHTRTRDEIAAWLLDHVAVRCGVAPDALDPDVALADYGLSSAEVVQVTWSLQEWLGVPVPPQVVHEHPSIGALSLHLAAASDQER